MIWFKNQKQLEELNLYFCTIYQQIMNSNVDVVALDCEMVAINKEDDSALARVSIVDSSYDVLYDEYVKPDLPVYNYRTPVSGIRPSDLRNAKSFATVQREVRNLLQGKILVGHSLENDFDVLEFRHPKKMIRDTQVHFRGGRRYPPSLKKLASTKLGKNIQTGEHSSIEDAITCMEIYNNCKISWERGCR